MNKLMRIRKLGDRYVETVTTEGKLPATRSYHNWGDVEVRLLELGFVQEYIASIKAEFDAGKDSLSFVIP